MHPEILIAEDEPRRARLIQASLEAAGFQVIHATDSASAWSIIQTHDIVMALVDANVPGLHECNILLQVRADLTLSDLPVVILGEPASTEQAVEWLNMGADDYISRSLSSKLLVAEVHAKLRRGKRSGPVTAAHEA